MDGFVLSIDQGTTGTTALVFDRDCRVRGRGYTEFTQHYAQPGWVEHDAEEIWRVSLSAAAEATRTRDRTMRIRAVYNAFALTDRRRTSTASCNRA